MQKSIRTAAFVLVALAIPAVSYAREPMGGNPRPPQAMASAGEPMGGNPRPPQAASSALLNSVVFAISLVSGR